MALKLVYGPANSGKTGFLYKVWLEALKAGGSPTLVLPTTADVQRAKKELAQKSGSIIGGWISNYNDLFRRIIEHSDREPMFVSSYQRDLLLKAAIAKSKLDLLDPSSQYDGFAKAVFRTFDELISNGISPASFSKHLENADKNDFTFANEMALIYTNYMELISKLGLREVNELGFIALDKLRDMREQSGTFIFHNFEDFTFAQRKLIEELTLNNELFVSVIYEEKRAALEASEKTFNWLKNIASGDVLKFDSSKSNYSNKTLYLIDKGLFSGEKIGETDDLSAVQLLSAAGHHNEVELAAAEISKLIKGSDGRGEYGPHEIAVIVRNVNAYRSHINRIFKLCNLPFSFRSTYKMNETSFGTAYLAIMRYLCFSAEDDDLLLFFRTKYSGISSKNFFELEKKALKYNNLDTLPFYLKKSLGIDSENILRNQKSVIDAVQILRDIASKMLTNGFKDAVSADNNTLEHNQNDIKVYEAVMNLLNDTAGLLDAEDADIELNGVIDLRSIYSNLSAITIETPEKPEEYHIQVLTPVSARSRRFKTVFILGLNEGEYPKRKQNDPFLSDSERKRLKNSGLTGLDTDLYDVAEEMRLFYSIVTRARKKLYLSYRSSDEQGNLRLTSFFLDDLLSLFNDEQKKEIENAKKTKELKDVVFGSLDKCPNSYEVERSVAKLGLKKFKNLTGDIKTKISASIEKSKPYKVDEMALSNGFSDGLYNKNKEIGATHIDEYIYCPYMSFAARSLKLRPLFEEFGMREVGSILHIVMHELYVSMSDLGYKLTDDSSLEIFFKKALDLAGEQIEDKLKNNELTESDIDLTKHEITRLVLNILREDAEYAGTFYPKYTETEFGEGKQWPALEISGQKISGKIDRVDIDEANRKAVVYDYKTGSAKNLNSILNNNEVQVLLYKRAVDNALSCEGITAIGAQYRYVRKNESAGFTFEYGNAIGLKVSDIEKSSAFNDQLEEMLKEVFESIKSGSIKVREVACPDYCNFKLVCRKEEY